MNNTSLYFHYFLQLQEAVFLSILCKTVFNQFGGFSLPSSGAMCAYPCCFIKVLTI